MTTQKSNNQPKTNKAVNAELLEVMKKAKFFLCFFNMADNVIASVELVGKASKLSPAQAKKFTKDNAHTKLVRQRDKINWQTVDFYFDTDNKRIVFKFRQMWFVLPMDCKENLQACIKNSTRANNCFRFIIKDKSLYTHLENRISQRPTNARREMICNYSGNIIKVGDKCHRLEQFGCNDFCASVALKTFNLEKYALPKNTKETKPERKNSKLKDIANNSTDKPETKKTKTTTRRKKNATTKETTNKTTKNTKTNNKPAKQAKTTTDKKVQTLNSLAELETILQPQTNADDNAMKQALADMADA